jgi:hypothetical protein
MRGIDIVDIWKLLGIVPRISLRLEKPIFTMASRPETMFAWRKHRGNPEPVWEEVPVPKPGPTGVLVKILASGGSLSYNIP